MKKNLSDIIEMGLRGNSVDNLVDGWSFHIEEVSSNVYRITGLDKKGNRVSSYGIDPEKVLMKCIRDAQRIISKERFLTNIKSKVLRIFGFRD